MARGSELRQSPVCSCGAGCEVLPKLPGLPLTPAPPQGRVICHLWGGARQDFSKLELTSIQAASSPGTHGGALGQADTAAPRARPAQSLLLVGVKICFALLLRGRLWARALPELLLAGVEDQPGQRRRGKPKCHGVFCRFLQQET